MTLSKSTDDIRIEEIRPLVAPRVLMEGLPLSETATDLVSTTRSAAEAILAGQDDRLFVVAGPCSIHDREAAIEYAGKLAQKAKELEEDLLVAMRVYFEKPRTTVGWKGYINDPSLDQSYDINRGLELARSLLIQLAEMGVPTGTEFLDTITPQYIADVVAWGAIGARTTESQVHRQLASGLSMPVGFKNGTDGNIKIAIDAIGASKGSHHFLSVTKQGVSAIVKTAGNDSCHVILRGSSSGTNYDEESVAEVVAQLEAAGLPPHVMVDCSHGNSSKDPNNQPGVASSIAAQIASGSNAITGVMIESHLVEGNQSASAEAGELTYGQSITDACVSWETTEGMLDELSAAVAARRAARAGA